jgi:hypothetical protein
VIPLVGSAAGSCGGVDRKKTGIFASRRVVALSEANTEILDSIKLSPE